MKHILRSLSLAMMLAALLASPTLAQDDLQDETILMTFIPNIQFAPMYVAIEGGHFADYGYDVSLEYLNEPDVVDLVAAEQNDFGIVSGEQVILAASRGRPIVYVYEWFQAYPIGIVYDSALGIESAADLEGVRVGIPGRFGATYSGFITLMESADLTENDVQLEEIGFNAPDVFCVGGVQASVIYTNNEPLQIESRVNNGECGDVESIEVLRVADAVDLVSNGLITNQTLIESNPDKVRAIVDAYDTGLEISINNPARAYLLSAPYIEGLPLEDDLRAELERLADEQDAFLATEPTREEIQASRVAIYETLLEQFDASDLLQMQVLLESIELWDADQLGFTELAAWQNMQETLLSLEQLDEAIDLESVYTNEYLPEAD